MVGFLSVIFWGYVSGSDGVVRTARALGKVRSFRDGRAGQTPTSKNELVLSLTRARESVVQKDYGKALYQLMSIKYLGMSFASKVVMFMNPSQTAIYDSVIAERLSKHESLNSLYIKTLGATEKEKIKQCSTYEKWCDFCFQTAEDLNRHKACWTDWDKVPDFDVHAMTRSEVVTAINECESYGMKPFVEYLAQKTEYGKVLVPVNVHCNPARKN